MDYFIEKVKLHPCLWDMNDMLYRDIGKKDMVWESIANECGMANGKESKLQWKKIRDSHREAMRRRKTCTGQAAQKIKPWKYETIMEFLLPQVENRPNSTNFSNNSQDSTNDTLITAEITDTLNTADSNINNTDTLNTEDSNINNTDTLNAETSNINNTDLGASSSTPESSLVTRRFLKTERKKQRKIHSDNLCKILEQREKIREKRKCERDQFRRRLIDIDRTPQDALSSLFNSFCQKTRELPKYLQLRVQRDCFESITRAEEEAMSFQPMNTYLSPSSSPASTYGYSKATSNPDNISILPDASPASSSDNEEKF